MKDLIGLRPLALIAALLAAALLIIAALVRADAARLITPSPEDTAAELIKAMGAHRYTGARNKLSDDLQQQFDEKSLRLIVNRIEQMPLKGIQDAHGQQAHEQGDAATASVEVKFGNHQIKVIEIGLSKEKGIWKVNSLDALQAFADQ